jgi:L-asparaginase
MNNKLHIVACGGTFDKIYLPNQGQLGFGASVVEDLIEQASLQEDISVSHPMSLDSLDMTGQHLEMLTQHILALEAKYIIVIHGTDTMVTSAQYTSERNANKTVLFTGAMVPARLPHSDAQLNLGYAIGKIHSLESGVWIAMNGSVFAPNNCSKNKTIGRFEETEP